MSLTDYLTNYTEARICLILIFVILLVILSYPLYRLIDRHHMKIIKRALNYGIYVFKGGNIENEIVFVRGEELLRSGKSFLYFPTGRVKDTIRCTIRNYKKIWAFNEIDLVARRQINE